MNTIEARVSTQNKRTKPAPSAKSEKPAITKKTYSKQAIASKVDPSDDLHAARVTKHDRILAMLNHRDGVSVPELMEATSWQQHSVRGFLAGTIKKKLGLALTSSKTAGNLRRYRIDAKRGR